MNNLIGEERTDNYMTISMLSEYVSARHGPSGPGPATVLGAEGP